MTPRKFSFPLISILFISVGNWGGGKNIGVLFRQRDGTRMARIYACWFCRKSAFSIRVRNNSAPHTPPINRPDKSLGCSAKAGAIRLVPDSWIGSAKTLLVNRGMTWHTGTQIPQILADTANAAAKTNTTSGYQRHQRSTTSISFVLPSGLPDFGAGELIPQRVG